MTGLGVARDDMRAAELLTEATLSGNVGAKGNLAIMYAHGQGVPHNEALATRWLKSAAIQGDASSQ
ncbi:MULTISPECIES: tetratricopeptide repeat protein [Burkholderiaceae]|uniref:Sel1 repeat family protein n=1 Tax=Caballeronia sordidicola TaxID=196367 RepID=A0A242M538_CABSO|nr:hypothetical protein AXG89_22780 [Burkholderia sp. PAMC 26561]AME27451.1 hypothetical protein AXG89_26325 [Burkholderia sp. PAMC 26561]OTP66212.1 hypothetical protein PAMC26577_38120 [Caballeronia sordidicola]